MMISPNEFLQKLNTSVSKNVKFASAGALIVGLFTHMSILVSDIPNHDGLASMYFDQNMITSGRWFLMVACGFSSFFSLPWLIGILSVCFLAVTAGFLVDLLEIKNSILAVLTAAVFVTFPSLASNFAYVFTMDGYMLGLMFSVIAVWCVKKYPKFGWIFGAIFLAFGMGTYQAYVSVTILLSMFMVARLLMEDTTAKEKAVATAKYVGMGVLGALLYYIILNILLKLEGKVLDTYQGINGMQSGNGVGLAGTLKAVFSDFGAFVTASNVLIPTKIVFFALCILFVCMVVSLVMLAMQKKLLRKPLFYVFGVLLLPAIPVAANAILFISTDVTYHVLMRFQYSLFVILPVAVIDRALSNEKETKTTVILSWAATLSVIVCAFSYLVLDNVAYSNLLKKYEKTYGYCLRLADRIEQTEGYYEGIPIAMVGVVGEDSYPVTDVTRGVTDGLLGIPGDFLLYKSENYADFMKYYLGITFNFVSEDEVVNFYNEPFYAKMESFPGATSVLLHDGTIYVKTENVR